MKTKSKLSTIRHKIDLKSSSSHILAQIESIDHLLKEDEYK